MCRWAELCATGVATTTTSRLVAGITGAPASGARRARASHTVERLAAAPLPFDPPLDGDESGQPRARPRAGAHPGRGRGLPKPIHELLLPLAGRADRAGARAGDAARARPRRPVPRPRGRPVRVRRRASTTSSACWTSSADFTRSGRATRDRPDGRHARRREARVRAADRTSSRAPRASPRACTSTTTRRTSRRAQAADGPPRDAGRGGGSAAARRRPRRPVPGGAAGRPRVGRELLDQAARAAVRLRAGRSRCATPARASSRSRSGSSSATASGPSSDILGRDRGYNRDDVAEHAAAPRLARGAAA